MQRNVFRSVYQNSLVSSRASKCQLCTSRLFRAAERCQNEKRKTINGEDLLWAMNALGFENYVEPLKTFLVKYRDVSSRRHRFWSSLIQSPVYLFLMASEVVFDD